VTFFLFFWCGDGFVHRLFLFLLSLLSRPEAAVDSAGAVLLLFPSLLSLRLRRGDLAVKVPSFSSFFFPVDQRSGENVEVFLFFLFSFLECPRVELVKSPSFLFVSSVSDGNVKGESEG